MSYPDSRYVGDEGEVSAVFRPADTAPDIARPTVSYHYLATTGSTDGEFGLYRVDFDTLRRTPKLSAAFYRNIIARNAVDV